MSESELAAASRDELIGLIRQLEAALDQRDAVIGELQKRIGALERLLAGRGGPGMPGNKPTLTKPAAPVKPRKPRDQGFGRPRLPPTETVQHALDVCPDCGTRLVGGWIQATREVIELPVVPVRVIEHQYVARECPLCQKRQVPPVDLTGIVLDDQQRLGIGVISLITTLREEGRFPFATIQWYLATVHRLQLSVGELVRVVGQVAERAQATVVGIQQAIQASPVVHADETGWREKGTNGYVWTFRTPTHSYFVRRGRNKEVVDEVLGAAFAGVIVCDFYASYDHYPGLKQRCWAHLLRDIHDLTQLYPSDSKLADWAAAVHDLYDEAKAFAAPQETVRLAKQRACEQRLLALCHPFLADPLAVQGKLCRRIAKYLPDLFVFVGNPLVPPTNNAAERSLRHLVTCRKISGGTQSSRGTTIKMTLASLFGTWRLQDLNPLVECHRLLQSPHQ
jgi:transposase